ncbi:MAG TPA: hypothetical protein VLM05_07715, partial [Mycobacteriales bacterium]|nr:hypothetical protein [Mycobacteriales bacterium]
MAITQEMFRFVTTRRPEQALRYRVDRRLVRDLRATHPGSLLVTLFAAGPFPPKVSAAEAYARGSGFVAADDPLVLALEPAADYFRRELVPGAVLADLQAAFQAEQPALAALLATRPSANVLQATVEFIGRLWDSTYTLVTLGFDRYVSTQYCADALRVYQVLRLWWLHVAAGRETWTGGTFDEYELIIDLDAAQDPGSRTGTPAGTSAGTAGRDRAPGRPAALIAPGTGGPSVSVPLTVGGTMPPVVGDLLLVEQELRRYELGEMAETQTIMRGERREQTIRTLARTSQTTTTTTA